MHLVRVKEQHGNITLLDWRALADMPLASAAMPFVASAVLDALEP